MKKAVAVLALAFLALTALTSAWAADDSRDNELEALRARVTALEAKVDLLEKKIQMSPPGGGRVVGEATPLEPVVNAVPPIDLGKQYKPLPQASGGDVMVNFAPLDDPIDGKKAKFYYDIAMLVPDKQAADSAHRLEKKILASLEKGLGEWRKANPKADPMASDMGRTSFLADKLRKDLPELKMNTLLVGAAPRP